MSPASGAARGASVQAAVAYASRTRTSSCCSARPGTWPSASCCRGCTTCSSPGCCPRSSAIIGTSPPEFACPTTTSRAHAQAACDQFGNCKADRAAWDAVRLPAVVRRRVARRPVAAGTRSAAEKAMRRVHGACGTAHVDRAAVPLGGAAVRVRLRGADARRVAAWTTSDARVIIEKPFGDDLASARAAERRRARGLRRVAGLQDRPLPRQGVGRQHPRVPVRERAVRADLEPAAHQVRADRRAGDAVRRASGPRSTTRPAPTGTWW